MKTVEIYTLLLTALSAGELSDIEDSTALFEELERVHAIVSFEDSKPDSVVCRLYQQSFSRCRLILKDALSEALERSFLLLDRGDALMMNSYIAELGEGFYDKKRLDEIIHLTYGCWLQYYPIGESKL